MRGMVPRRCPGVLSAALLSAGPANQASAGTCHRFGALAACSWDTQVPCLGMQPQDRGQTQSRAAGVSLVHSAGQTRVQVSPLFIITHQAGLQSGGDEAELQPQQRSSRPHLLRLLHYLGQETVVSRFLVL